MEQKCLMDALVQAKRMGNLLNEVQDLSRQLGEAIDRSDQVSVELLVNMRREPVEKLMTADQTLQDLVSSAPDVDTAVRLSGLLAGEPPQGPEETMLANQIASNRRRLDQVLELDKVVNAKLSRGEPVRG